MNTKGWLNDVWMPVRSCLLACCLCLASGAAWPLDLDVLCDFRIAPQKLTTALVEFSRQANTPVISDTTEVDRFDSAGISGRMALKDALRELLAGTRLDYKVTEKGVIAVGVFARDRVSREAKKSSMPPGPASAVDLISDGN